MNPRVGSEEPLAASPEGMARNSQPHRQCSVRGHYVCVVGCTATSRVHEAVMEMPLCRALVSNPLPGKGAWESQQLRCTRTHVHTYMHKLTHNHVYSYVRRHTPACIYLCPYVHAHTHWHAYPCTQSHALTRLHIDMHMHRHSHTHTQLTCVHTHTHALTHEYSLHTHAHTPPCRVGAAQPQWRGPEPPGGKARRL